MLCRPFRGFAVFAVPCLCVLACSGSDSAIATLHNSDDRDAAAGGSSTVQRRGVDIDSGGESDSHSESDSGGGSSGRGGSSGSDGSSATSGPDGGTTTYACVTQLTPAPVCDSKHDYCVCTRDAECNSGGTNVGNKGGCQSSDCSGGACTGGPFTDKTGCSVVGCFCNLGGNNACPANTVCEGGPSSGWAAGHEDLCGNSLQCCWCTSDSGCPVSGKCINDATQNQCKGKGPCTGAGTDWDGMHCQLTSPGIPMCTAQ